jgi:hypothetical protein
LSLEEFVECVEVSAGACKHDDKRTDIEEKENMRGERAEQTPTYPDPVPVHTPSSTLHGSDKPCVGRRSSETARRQSSKSGGEERAPQMTAVSRKDEEERWAAYLCEIYTVRLNSSYSLGASVQESLRHGRLIYTFDPS